MCPREAWEKETYVKLPHNHTERRRQGFERGNPTANVIGKDRLVWACEPLRMPKRWCECCNALFLPAQQHSHVWYDPVCLPKRAARTERRDDDSTQPNQFTSGVRRRRLWTKNIKEDKFFLERAVEERCEKLVAILRADFCPNSGTHLRKQESLECDRATEGRV